jgi:hypothetical protein
VMRRRELRSAKVQEQVQSQRYLNGERIHHIRSIQVPSRQIWSELFGNETTLNPELCAYAEASIAFMEDQTQTLQFAGQMEVSLIVQENYRPGVHVAIFIIQLTPHRQFHDGHVIQREFGEGSATHQMINRRFNTDDYAVVSQATEYSILEYVADDDEMLELLHNCFMDDNFNTVRFPSASNNVHRLHEFF